MTVLFLVATPRVSEEPWLSHVRSELGGRLPLRVAAANPDFAGIETVIDVGGWASNDVIDSGAAAGVRLWQVLGYGLDHIDIGHALEAGIMVAHTPGPASAIPLAEHAIHLALALEKRYSECQRNLQAGVFSKPIVGELAGQTLLIIGFGASGRELAVRARAFAMRVLAIDLASPSSPDIDEGHSIAELDELLPKADVVSLHVPLTETTRHLIDGTRLSLMKPTALLVNVARGQLVDQEALVQALTEGRLRGAGLDVFEDEPIRVGSPLLELESVVATPHIAGMTEATARRRASIAVANALRVAAGSDPEHRIFRPP